MARGPAGLENPLEECEGQSRHEHLVADHYTAFGPDSRREIARHAAGERVEASRPVPARPPLPLPTVCAGLAGG